MINVFKKNKGGSGEAKFFDPRASILPVSASHVYGLYRSAFTEYKDNKNMSLIELRLFMWIRRQLDSKVTFNILEEFKLVGFKVKIKL
jgi:hypothetical protein